MLIKLCAVVGAGYIAPTDQPDGQREQQGRPPARVSSIRTDRRIHSDARHTADETPTLASACPALVDLDGSGDRRRCIHPAVGAFYLICRHGLGLIAGLIVQSVGGNSNMSI